MELDHTKDGHHKLEEDPYAARSVPDLEDMMSFLIFVGICLKALPSKDV
jgi:hypothetical protein